MPATGTSSRGAKGSKETKRLNSNGPKLKDSKEPDAVEGADDTLKRLEQRFARLEGDVAAVVANNVTINGDLIGRLSGKPY